MNKGEKSICFSRLVYRDQLWLGRGKFSEDFSMSLFSSETPLMKTRVLQETLMPTNNKKLKKSREEFSLKNLKNSVTEKEEGNKIKSKLKLD